MGRHISRSDGNIGEENLHIVLSESQFADVWRSRSIAGDVNDEAESVEIVKQKSKPTQQWIKYQLDEVQKKRSSCCNKENLFGPKILTYQVLLDEETCFEIHHYLYNKFYLRKNYNILLLDYLVFFSYFFVF